MGVTGGKLTIEEFGQALYELVEEALAAELMPGDVAYLLAMERAAVIESGGYFGDTK